jgi:hypothetical protein
MNPDGCIGFSAFQRHDGRTGLPAAAFSLEALVAPMPSTLIIPDRGSTTRALKCSSAQRPQSGREGDELRHHRRVPEKRPLKSL